MKNCVRCSFYGRKPNKTAKLIDGVPICSQCMLEDAKQNRGIVIDYSSYASIDETKVRPTRKSNKKE